LGVQQARHMPASLVGPIWGKSGPKKEGAVRRPSSSQPLVFELDQHPIAVIAAVCDDSGEPVLADITAALWRRRHRIDLLFGLRQGLVNAGGVAAVRPLNRHSHDRPGAHVHRVLRLVRQVRTPILRLGLGDPCVGVGWALPIVVRHLLRRGRSSLASASRVGVLIPDEVANRVGNSGYDSPLSRRTMLRIAAFASRVVASIPIVFPRSSPAAETRSRIQVKTALRAKLIPSGCRPPSVNDEETARDV
jgi:hypothetical protein